MQIVNKKQKIEIIELDEAFSLMKNGGLLVQVWSGKASILRGCQKDGCYSFHEIAGGIDSQNLRTTSENGDHGNALLNIKDRIREAVTRGVMSYYYFSTLEEFAEAVIENHWN